MRRNKIETEFRVKAIGMQIAEIDFILSSHNKEFHYQKNLCEEIEKSIFAQNEKILEIMQNPYTQIVLPCGQNEVVMSGKLEDCKNAIFLNILDVDDINYIIKAHLDS
ncbi:CFAP43 family protein [Megaselia abdita]